MRVAAPTPNIAISFPARPRSGRALTNQSLCPLQSFVPRGEPRRELSRRHLGLGARPPPLQARHTPRELHPHHDAFSHTTGMYLVGSHAGGRIPPGSGCSPETLLRAGEWFLLCGVDVLLEQLLDLHSCPQFITSTGRRKDGLVRRLHFTLRF